jgi:hypothetical protein
MNLPYDPRLTPPQPAVASPQKDRAPASPQAGAILPLSYWNLLLSPPFVPQQSRWEEIMLKITSALVLLSSAAFAEDKQIDSNALQECPRSASRLKAN